MASAVPRGEPQRAVTESDVALLDPENRDVLSTFLSGGVEEAKIALRGVNGS